MFETLRGCTARSVHPLLLPPTKAGRGSNASCRPHSTAGAFSSRQGHFFHWSSDQGGVGLRGWLMSPVASGPAEVTCPSLIGSFIVFSRGGAAFSPSTATSPPALPLCQ